MEQNDALYMKCELLFPEAFIVHVSTGLEEKWIMSKNINTYLILGSRPKK